MYSIFNFTNEYLGLTMLAGLVYAVAVARGRYPVYTQIFFFTNEYLCFSFVEKYFLISS